MKRTLWMVAGLALLAPRAFGQSNPGDDSGRGGAPPGEKMQRMPSGRMGGKSAMTNVEPNKHLLEIDAYLTSAMDNTKLLYQSSQLPPGKLDAAIAKEDLGNVERAINSALTHTSHLKSLPEARIKDTAKLEQLRSDLTRARNLVGQLRTAVNAGDRAQVASLSSQLYAGLRSADETFGQIADQQHLVRLERITVPERQPVGGAIHPPAGREPGGTMNAPSDSPSGGTPSPSAPASPGEPGPNTQGGGSY